MKRKSSYLGLGLILILANSLTMAAIDDLLINMIEVSNLDIKAANNRFSQYISDKSLQH